MLACFSSFVSRQKSSGDTKSLAISGEQKERVDEGAERGVCSRKSAHFPAAIWRTISPVSGKALPAAITTTAREGETAGAEKGRIYRIADAHIRTLSFSLSLSLSFSSLFCQLHFSLFPCLFIRPISQTASKKNEKKRKER